MPTLSLLQVPSLSEQVQQAPLSRNFGDDGCINSPHSTIGRETLFFETSPATGNRVADVLDTSHTAIATPFDVFLDGWRKVSASTLQELTQFRREDFGMSFFLPSPRGCGAGYSACPPRGTSGSWDSSLSDIMATDSFDGSCVSLPSVSAQQVALHRHKTLHYVNAASALDSRGSANTRPLWELNKPTPRKPDESLNCDGAWDTPAKTFWNSNGQPNDAMINVGPREPLQALSDEFKYNASFRDKVFSLEAQGYVGWRRIRGDGNCFYRAVGFSMLEQLVMQPLHVVCDWTFEFFRRLRSAGPTDGNNVCGERNGEVGAEQDAHADLLRHLECLINGVGIGCLQTIFNDTTNTIDLALVRALKRLVANYMTVYAEDANQCSGITFEMLCAAEGHDGASGFINNVVLPLGIEAEGVILTVLPKALGFNLRIAILDRRESSELVFSDYGAEHSESSGEPWRPNVHVQLRPGHYDVLYFSREESPAISSAARRPCSVDWADRSARVDYHSLATSV